MGQPFIGTQKHLLIDEAKTFITKMICPPCPPITIHEIRSEIISKFSETYSVHIIKNFVKNRWGYSYKRACSRPPKYAQSSIKSAKGLFCTELLRMLHREELIFNVDEWSFTRSVKSHYSWLPTGRSSALINDVWRGSASLLFATGSNFQWFAVIKPGTVNSKIFSIFMKLLEKVLDDAEVIDKTRPLVIIDNAKTHTSRFTKAVMKSLKLDVKPLPP